MASLFGGRRGQAHEGLLTPPPGGDVTPPFGGGFLSESMALAAMHHGGTFTNPWLQVDWEQQMENADKQQAHLHHMQWNLVKSQMSGFQREIATLRADATKADANLREVRDTFDVVLHGMRKQFEQALQDQFSRVGEAVAAHELQQKMNTEELKVAQLELAKVVEGMDVRVQSQWQVMQAEMSQQNGALHDRLSTQDEHRCAMQAALDRIDRDFKQDFSCLHDKCIANGAAVRELEANLKKDLLRAKADNEAVIRGAGDGQRKAVDDLERHLAALGDEQRGILGLARDHARELAAELRAETDNKLDSERRIRAELKEESDSMGSGLKKDLSRVTSDHSGRLCELHDLIAAHKAHLDWHVDSVRGKHEDLTNQVKDQERIFRRDLGVITDETQSAQSRFADMSDKARRDQQAQAAAGLEELDRSLRKELLKQAGEQKAGHVKVTETFETHRSGVDRMFLSEKSAWEDHLQSAISELERKLAKDLKRQSEEAQSSSGLTIERCRSALDDHRVTFQGELADHRERVERSLAGMQGLMDSQLLSEQERVEVLQRETRRELERNVEGQAAELGRLQKLLDDVWGESRRDLQAGLERVDVDLKGQIARLGNEHSRRFESLDVAFKGELAAQKAESQLSMQCGLDEANKQLVALANKHQKGFSEMGETLSSLESFEQTLNRQLESLDALLQSEKTERFHHHASLQKRIDVIETALVREDEELRELRERPRIILKEPPVQIRTAPVLGPMASITAQPVSPRSVVVKQQQHQPATAGGVQRRMSPFYAAPLPNASKPGGSFTVPKTMGSLRTAGCVQVQEIDIITKR